MMPQLQTAIRFASVPDPRLITDPPIAVRSCLLGCYVAHLSLCWYDMAEGPDSDFLRSFAPCDNNLDSGHLEQ